MFLVDYVQLQALPMRLLPGGASFVLDDDVSFNVGTSDYPTWVSIPKGFETDLASIPSWAGIFGFAKLGRHSWAALLHDWCYTSQCTSFEVANALFHQELKRSGVGAFHALVMTCAVQAAGRCAYDNAPERWAHHRPTPKSCPMAFLRVFFGGLVKNAGLAPLFVAVLLIGAFVATGYALYAAGSAYNDSLRTEGAALCRADTNVAAAEQLARERDQLARENAELAERNARLESDRAIDKTQIAALDRQRLEAAKVLAMATPAPALCAKPDTVIDAINSVIPRKGGS